MYFLSKNVFTKVVRHDTYSKKKMLLKNESARINFSRTIWNQIQETSKRVNSLKYAFRKCKPKSKLSLPCMVRQSKNVFFIGKRLHKNSSSWNILQKKSAFKKRNLQESTFLKLHEILCVLRLTWNFCFLLFLDS